MCSLLQSGIPILSADNSLRPRPILSRFAHFLFFTCVQSFFVRCVSVPVSSCGVYGLIRAPALCDGHLNTNARRRPAQTPTDVTTRALFLPGRGRKRCVLCNAFSSIEGASGVSSATPWEVCLWRELAPLARERYRSR